MLVSLLKKLISWGIFFLILILIIDQIILPFYVRHNSNASLPDVTGKHFVEAKKILESNGLEIIRAGQMVNSQYVPGTVILQFPKPKTIVKAGRRIYVTLTTPEQPIQIPNVIGQSERDAQFILSSAGLVVDSTIIWEYSPLYPEGVVCNQSLYEGTRISRGTTIRLTFSLGPIPREVEVPNYMFNNLQNVQKEIVKVGLRVGKIINLPNNEYLPNTVLKQSPEAGTMVLPGDSLNLIISVLDSTANNSSVQ